MVSFRYFKEIVRRGSTIYSNNMPQIETNEVSSTSAGHWS